MDPGGCWSRGKSARSRESHMLPFYSNLWTKQTQSWRHFHYPLGAQASLADTPVSAVRTPGQRSNNAVAVGPQLASTYREMNICGSCRTVPLTGSFKQRSESR